MSITIQQAIGCLEDHQIAMEEFLDVVAQPENYEHTREFIDAEKMAIDALREKAERENPQPLTLEELRQMDRDPVWIKAEHYGLFADVVKIRGREDGDCFVGVKICYWLQENGYSKTWIAYRHKPKEA